MNPYIGHPSQLNGIEQYTLCEGRGAGMHLLQVWTQDGLEVTICPDRCADITRVRYKGVNMSYFAPCGYVAPQYYDDAGTGFLKSFTAGFITTCGLVNVGPPCEDAGEILPQHGTINAMPAERFWWTEHEDRFEIHAVINDSRMFSRKLMLHRMLVIEKETSVIRIIDTVENQGDSMSPLMLLYHMNFGYPLIDENVKLSISSVKVEPCDEKAERGIREWNQVTPPVMQAEEQCFQHYFADEGHCVIYNPKLKIGASLDFDPKVMDNLTQWKMLSYRDYVIGLEPGNCTTDGRDKDRARGILKFLAPGESKRHEVDVRFYCE